MRLDYEPLSPYTALPAMNFNTNIRVEDKVCSTPVARGASEMEMVGFALRSSFVIRRTVRTREKKQDQARTGRQSFQKLLPITGNALTGTNEYEYSIQIPQLPSLVLHLSHLVQTASMVC